MNKKGKLYIMLLCALSIFLLFSAYYKVSSTLKQHSEYGLTENVGSKQAALLNAVVEGERIILYVKEVNKQVAVEASVANPCGEPYLTTKLLGRGDCEDSVAVNHVKELTAALASYPGGTLTDIRWKESKAADGTVKLEGRKLIPVTTDSFKRVQSTATFAGSIAAWPTKHDTVTSVFGNRNIAVDGSSKNHPGIDIAVPGNRIGEPITSLTDGTALYYEAQNPVDNWVQVDTGSVTFRYLHVTAAQGIPTAVQGTQGVPVKAGEVIAYTGNHPGNPHLHLLVEMPEITSGAVAEKWPQHVSASTAQTELKSYAVTRTPSEPAVLDPVCFFDRTYITEKLRKSDKLAADTFEACDAYERDFALSQRLNAQQQLPVQAAALSVEMQREFDTARQNVQRFGLVPFIASALDEERDDAPINDKFILAVITQESKGDPSAVSDTGAVGAMQFTYGTAMSMRQDAVTKQWEKIDDTYDDIFEKAVPCNCQGDNCQPRACTPGNDDRYDAEKNIRAGVRYYSSLTKEYGEYGEHGLAFALAAYNGGNAVVDRAITKVKQKRAEVTWTNVKSEIAVDTAVEEAKRREITGYVDAILTYYGAWGGVTFAQTQITENALGHYDLHVTLDNIKPSVFDGAIRKIQERIGSCTDKTCVDSIIVSEAQEAGLVATHEVLGASTGCLAAAERAQLFLTSQFASCQASPDANCACPFVHGIDAQYDIDASQTSIVKLNGALVSTKSDIGIGSGDGADSDESVGVQFYTADRRIVSLAEKGRLVLDGEGAHLLLADETPREAHVVVSPTKQPFTALYKLPHVVAFTSEPVRMCVAAPKPVAYCLKQGEKSVVFFVDMQMRTTPSATLSVRSVERNIHASVVLDADKRLPYVLVASGDARYYLRVKDTTPAGQFFEEQSLKLEDQRALYNGTSYTFIVPAHDSYTVSLLDENLRETYPVFVSVPPVSMP